MTTDWARVHGHVSRLMSFADLNEFFACDCDPPDHVDQDPESEYYDPHEHRWDCRSRERRKFVESHKAIAREAGVEIEDDEG